MLPNAVMSKSLSIGILLPTLSLRMMVFYFHGNTEEKHSTMREAVDILFT